MKTRMLAALVVVTFIASPQLLLAETEVRVATYNIRYLNTAVDDPSRGDRLQKLHDVIELLEADIIGLQEIDDREALEKVFPADEWLLVIDDDSGENQDLALAVRRPWRLPNMPQDLDAEAEHFLFSNASNILFPDRRDVLSIRVQAPDEDISFYVMVVHAKSRYGGRASTDARRVGAAQALVERIQNDFSEEPFVLLGDFNDNPDDQSMNVLETGNPQAAGGPEEIAGPFLVNLTEPLCAENQVSHGLKSDAVIDNNRLDTVDPLSRDRNNLYRGTDQNTGDILFDQILIPAWMIGNYIDGSATVFDYAVAAQGNNTTRASDHVPVYADFVFEPEEEGPTTPAGGLLLAGVIPNPVGTDAHNEQVILLNAGETEIDLSGWEVRDDDNASYALTGSIPAGATRVITLDRGPMLANTGDTVWLVDPQGDEHQHHTYSSADAISGATIMF